METFSALLARRERNPFIAGGLSWLGASNTEHDVMAVSLTTLQTNKGEGSQPDNPTDKQGGGSQPDNFIILYYSANINI